MSSLTSFEDKGYPIISLICYGVTFLLASIVTRGKLNIRSGKNGGLPVIGCCVFLLAACVFLTFGPAAMRRISVHLFVLASAGFFGVATSAAHFAAFFTLFGTVTFLCMIGSAGILGYSTMMHSISEADCQAYFKSAVPLCADDGYLQYLRVISVFAYCVLAAAVVLILSSTTIGEQYANMGGDPNTQGGAQAYPQYPPQAAQPQFQA